MDQQVIDEIIEIMEYHNIVEAAYLFGSQAKNKSTENSDIDIAVLLKNDYTGSCGEIKVKSTKI